MSDETVNFSQEQLDELRAKCKKSLYFFCKAVLGYDKLDLLVHGPLCMMLQNRKKNRKGAVLPRSWFKSTVASVGYPIWRAINNRNIRILLCQNTFTNACGKLRSIAAHFESNPLFRTLFPELLPDTKCVWKADSLCIKRTKPNNEGTFDAAGIRTAVVGRHYDLIIEDDTVSPDLDNLGDDNVMPSKEDIDKAIGWHRLAYPLLNEPSDEIVIIGTRWFERDLISWVQAEDPAFQWYERAVRETDGKPDPKGQPAWPARFDNDKLQELERVMGPYLFSCLYMNRPMASADMIFRKEWFRFYEEAPAQLMVYTTVDPAGDPEQNKGKTDWNVVCTTGKDMKTGYIYVLEITRRKCNPGELIDILFSHVKRWHPLCVKIESIAYQASLQYWVKERMRKENTFFIVEGLTHGRHAKNQRIMGLQPMVASGAIRFRTEHAWLIAEAEAFPLGAHDDGLDCLSMGQELCRSTRGPEQAVQNRGSDPLSFDWAIEEIRTREQRAVSLAYDVLIERPGQSPVCWN